MHAGKRWLRGALALLALAGAGGVAASTAVPVAPGWAADPEEQLLMDVNIRRLSLGNGTRAYPTPDGVCVVLGDFFTALDVPMRIDLGAQKASGWAFNEANRIVIDKAARRAEFGGKSEMISNGTIREVPEGWCVDSKALSRWFGIGVEANVRASTLSLQAEAKLPVEMALERRERAARIKPASYDLKAFPRVRIPYRLWRTPALDFVVSGGMTYRASTGVKIDRQSSLYAAGEFARLSFDARLGTDNRGMPESVRLRAFRSDPEGRLLGPLKATHFAIGDVGGLPTPLVGSSAQGRGAVVTNRPLGQVSAFDKTSFVGELPSGWEAEIYRNGALLGFAATSADRRYRFDDVQLLYGENSFEIVLYGPQGQIRRRSESVNVGPESVPPGKTWYWAGASEVGHDVIGLSRDGTQQVRGWQATAGAEHGLDKRTTLAALVETLVIDDKRLSYVEGAVRRSIGPALVELSAARERGGGTAFRASLLGRFGGVNVNAESIVARDFVSSRVRDGTVQEHRLSLDVPVKLGKSVVPAHADVRFTKALDGSSSLEAATRLSANLRNFVVSSELAYRKQFAPKGGAPPRAGEFDLGLVGTGRVGDIRLRGGTRWQIAPQARFRTAELTGYWSASERADWEGTLAYDGQSRRGRARLAHIRRFDAMAVSLSGEAATDGSLAAGFNLSFSLGSDPTGGRALRVSGERLASSGSVRARVFRDLDNDGIHDSNEPIEKKAVITAGTRVSDAAANRAGYARVDGLDGFRAVAVGVDTSSLSDPGLVPRAAIQVVTPRPGVTAEVDIALVGGGDVEGVLVKSGGGGFEGLDIELIDAAGRVIATTRSDYDGYFLFERVAYGSYGLRLTRASAEAARVASAIDRRVEVAPDKPVVRLGTIAIDPLARIALAQESPKTTSP